MSKKSAERSRAERAQAALVAQQRAERRRQTLIVGIVVAAIVLIVGAGFAISTLRDTTGDTPTATPQAELAGGTPAIDGYTVTIGDPSAPKTITVYEDLQCPVCKAYEATTGQAVATAVAAGKVKVDYRMVAFLDDVSTTEYSSRALNALMVVLDTTGVDAFTKYHQLLYDNQPAEGSAGLSDDQLVQYAVQAGAKESVVRGPIEDGKFDQWVVNATDQMSKDGVRGTPTVLIDGKSAGSTPDESAQAVLAAVA
jgi:protein-disulfide isomerase